MLIDNIKCQNLKQLVEHSSVQSIQSRLTTEQVNCRKLATAYPFDAHRD